MVIHFPASGIESTNLRFPLIVAFDESFLHRKKNYSGFSAESEKKREGVEDKVALNRRFE